MHPLDRGCSVWGLDALLSGAVLVVAQVPVSMKDIHVHREDGEEEEAHHAVSRPKSKLRTLPMPVILGQMLSDFLDSSHRHRNIWR